jgi:hypothetical protein
MAKLGFVERKDGAEMKINFDKIEMAKAPSDVCECASGLQRAVIAASCLGTRAVVLWATGGVVLDAGEAGIDADDLFYPPGGDSGLEVWEGHINWTGGYSTPGGYCEPENTYDGAFRSPTADEWKAIVDNRNPWPCEKCGDTGLCFVDPLPASEG